ncbi:MAG: type IV toxin-antitoxin system AbiEi family antitoxin domain-containing protein [Kiritimatiellae bacterium]|nr:type IV toxin-antitoxin system AbiEi family antitoxin domain-containing protein [Kiritimatiellia bacterium]
MNQYETIYQHAVDNYGLVSVAAAKELGVHRKELLRWVKSGRLEKRWRGVYRLTHYVPTELDRYAEAVALVGGSDAIVFGESVLAMHDLALVNPAWLSVARSGRVRRALPDWIRVVPLPPDARRDEFEGIPCQNLADAFRACRATVMSDRLAQGVRDAEKRGLLRRAEAEALKREFPR